MTNKTLKKSPITYVLAQVKISAIEDIESYIPKLQESIRKKFPIPQKVSIQTVELKNEVAPNVYASTQWHFKDKESLVGIIVDKRSITIHTSKYIGFDEFQFKVKDILGKFNKILEISLSTRIGLRYINIVRSNFKKYVNPSLQGFYDKDDDNFLSNVETTRKTEDGFIRVRAIHPKNVAVVHQNKLVPQDLCASADQLSFVEHGKIGEEYIMLDIDNCCQKQNDFDIDDIAEVFEKLHKGIYETFCSAVTKEALKNWG